MSADEPAENPTDLPDSHPLAGYNGVLDDHEAHVDAIREYLEETDAVDSDKNSPTAYSEGDRIVRVLPVVTHLAAVCAGLVAAAAFGRFLDRLAEREVLYE